MKIGFMFTCLFTVVSAYAQQLPNSGFENWSFREEYIEPDGWISTNAFAFTGAVETCYPHEDARTGNWSAKLETRIDPLSQDTLKCILACGLNYEAPGMHYRWRPSTFSFYYQHNLRDTAVALLVLTKYNTLLKRRDTVGIAPVFFIDSTATFKKQTINITYLKPDKPDTCIAVFITSLKDKPWPGNYLIIDDMELSGFPLSTPEMDAPPVTIYPNPARDIVTIQSKEEITSWSVWTANGKLALHGTGERVDIAALKPATYIFNIQLKSGELITEKMYKN